MLQLVYHKN